jgi:GNAT superfamily N-acetyltransferase
MSINWNHRLAELTEDWIYYYKIYPWRQSIPEIAKEVLQLPFRHIHYLVFARFLTKSLPEISVDSSIEIRKFEPRDVPEVAVINRPSEAKLCTKRLARGHLGVSAIHTDKLVGYAWACTNIDPVLERVRIALKPFEFLCTDSFTSLDYRGRGVQTLLTMERFRMLHELGYERAICFIKKDNLPSIAVWKKLGGQIVGKIDFIRIGRWRYSRYRNISTFD